jgi:Subtilase family
MRVGSAAGLFYNARIPNGAECMTRKGTGFAIFLILSVIAANASAFEAESIFPTFDSKQVLTTDPVRIVFDASLDVATVNDATVFVSPFGGSAIVPGTRDVETTFVADDTVVFTQDEPWFWGRRFQLHITPNLKTVGGTSFSGALLNDGLFVANIPNDFVVPVWDPGDPTSVFVTTLDLLGYNPMDPDGPAEPWEIPGSHYTDAWKYSTGRADVIIAVVDTGVESWDQDTRLALFLNREELPLPNDNGNTCADYDCNSDGRFDVDDYSDDNRVTPTGLITAADLVEVFSDGVDDDGNGFVDDICGWDFFRGTNEPWCSREIPTGCHGQLQGSTATRRGDNGIGSRPGGCPNCTLLPIRTSTMILHGGAETAAAIRYAALMGASAISLSGVTLTWSAEVENAVIDAKELGALTVAASGDEMTYHHWMPACGEAAISVKTLFPLVPIDLVAGLGLDIIGFTETPATNYGPHTHLSIPSSSYSSSESTSLTAGAIGLINARARDLGLDLTAEEVKQLLTMTADDVADHCASVVNLFNVCQDGFDEHFGYGRMNLQRAMEALGDPDRGIDPAVPPSVQLLEPKWWQTIDSTQSPTVSVVAELDSRVSPYSWEVQIAKGHQPLEHEFETVATGTETGPRSGLLTEVPIADYVSDRWAKRKPVNQNTFEVTLRIQATYVSAKSGTVLGEDRKTISVHIDRNPETGLVDGFPIDIGASGESAPVLYDLDGGLNGNLEIVFGTGDGMVEALSCDSEVGFCESLPGFPVDLSGDDPRIGDSIFADVAVGDVFGDGTPEIVAVTMRGLVYAIDPDNASILPGFPVSADAPDGETSLAFAFGNGFLAAPVLADLNRDGILDIIAAASDQKAYAWTLAGQGAPPELLPGWPVTCRSEPGLVPPASECEDPGFSLPILATPAVGVLDPLHTTPDISDHPAVIVSTNEGCSGTTRTYAIFHDGMNNPIGPFLPGWPAKPKAPFAELLYALALIAGSSSNPAVYLDDQGAHIAVGVTGWFPQLVHYAEDTTTVENLSAGLAVTAAGSPMISVMRGGEDKQIVFPTVGAVRLDELGFQLMDSKVHGFEIDPPHENFMAGELEDLPLLTGVSAADLDGDGKREALAGSGGYILHAFDPDGGEAPGWPKYTHKWMAATPAVGDIDGDGLVEVVAVSREGYLYAWESNGPACMDGSLNSDWRRSHHDERNTGFYGTDTLPPARVTDFLASQLDSGQVRVTFTSPGDDWACGTALEYQIRYSEDPGAELTDPATFEAAAEASGVRVPHPGGFGEAFVISAEGAAIIALQAVDDAGNLSRISNPALVVSDPDDDDDADVDDSTSESDDDASCCG